MNNNTPIHLIVDTNLTNFTLSVKAYTNFNISFSDKILGTQFLPIPLEIKTLEFDKLACILSFYFIIYNIFSRYTYKRKSLFKFIRIR